MNLKFHCCLENCNLKSILSYWQSSHEGLTIGLGAGCKSRVALLLSPGQQSVTRDTQNIILLGPPVSQKGVDFTEMTLEIAAI